MLTPTSVSTDNDLWNERAYEDLYSTGGFCEQLAQVTKERDDVRAQFNASSISQNALHIANGNMLAHISNIEKERDDAMVKVADWQRQSESCESKLGQIEANVLVMELQAELESLRKQEPVAWINHHEIAIFADDRIKYPMGGVVSQSTARYLKSDHCDTPLYAAPMPQSCKVMEATEDMIIAGMEASVLGRASVDDERYVLSIYNAMIGASKA